MVAVYVHQMPAIEISDGMVHISSAQGEWFWRPSMFRAFVETGRMELAHFDQSGAMVLPFRREG